MLIRVRACGLNNTDVNTRSGWYSRTVNEATTGDAFAEVGEDDPTWGGAPISFPRIQGADVCGEIAAVGSGVDPARICTPSAPRPYEQMGQVGSLATLRVVRDCVVAS